MSARVEKGKRWFKFVLLMVGITAGIKALFAFSHPSMGNKLAEAFVQFIGGTILFGGPAFVLGWLTGKEEAPKTNVVTAIASTEVASQPTALATEPGTGQARTSTTNTALVNSVNPTSERHGQPNTLSTEQKLGMETSSDASQADATSDEQFFAMAFQELNSGRAAQGLWARCFAEVDGDENKAKARYLSARSAQLKAAHDARAQEDARRVREFEEAERLAKEERANRAAENEQKRRNFVEAGRMDHATIEECCAWLSAAGWSVERNYDVFRVRSSNALNSPPNTIEGLAQLRLFVEKNITFSQATQEQCIAELKKLGCEIVLKSNGLYSVRLPGSAKRVLEKVDEFREMLRNLLTKGWCPSCSAQIALNSQGCPRCNAIFTGTSTWKIRSFFQ